MRRDPALIGAVAPPEVHVMSFNVRRRIDLAWRAADRWSARRSRLETLLRIEAPTVVGVQEALPDQAAAIAEALGARYRFVGRGRGARGRGEGCPLFWDDDRLELLGWEQTALSDTPHLAGSTSWGNAIPRVVVSAAFHDRVTGSRVKVLNTHLDVFSARSRLHSARWLRERVDDEHDAAIVTADLNASAGSPAVRELLTDGVLRDTWAAAATRVTPAWATYANYRRPRIGRRIDIVAVGRGAAVRRVGIHGAATDGGWPSDHLPVQAVISLPESSGAS